MRCAAEQDVGRDPGGGLAMVPVPGREGRADLDRDNDDGDLGAAANALNQSAQQGASKELLFTLGEIEAARGNTDEAVKWYQKASADDPNWGKPLLKLGMTALKKGDKTDAAAKMQRVMAVDPTSAEAVQAKTVIDQLK